MDTQHLKASGSVDTTLEFELRADGVDLNSGHVYLSIEHDGYNCEIPCEFVGGTRWKVVVPKKFGDVATRQYKVNVIAEDFYFTPVGGELRFMKQSDVTADMIDSEKAPTVFDHKPSDFIKPISEPKQEDEETPSNTMPTVDSKPAESSKDEGTKEESIPAQQDTKADKDPDEEDGDKKKSIKETKQTAPTKNPSVKANKLKAILDEEKQGRMTKVEAEQEIQRQLKAERQRQIIQEHKAKRDRAEKLKKILAEEK